MSNLQLAGLILFLVGLVPFTIGGLIFFRHNDTNWNASLLRDSSWSWLDRKLGSEGILVHPKSRWWCGIGFPIGISGFVLLAVSTIPLGTLALFVALVGLVVGIRRFVVKGRQ
jgi:hypothetical protein